jgi:toxin ParE1/3/4
VTYRLRFSQIARDDLIALHAWIEVEADAIVADAYLERIEARCWNLTEFPNRGTPRDDLMMGVRSSSFERRILIFYRVGSSEVEIMRVVSAARETRSPLS